MKEIIHNSWQEVLSSEFSKDYYLHLREFLKKEYATQKIHPDMYHIYEALELTPYEKVKVVILGQDPYHGDGQAHGLSFSVKPGVKAPPSLVNIFKELKEDLGCEIPNNGCLKPWTQQGVLLLNTVLTVRAHQANSHRNMGWEKFTDRIIEILNEREKPIAFILWGAPARKKKKMITNPKHFIVESAHPSPLSAFNGFFGSRPFSKVNAFLEAVGEKPINWQIPNL